MKVISFNTMYIEYEKKYNPNSKFLLNSDDNERLLEIFKIINKNLNIDTVICLQECDLQLLNMFKTLLSTNYSIFQDEIDNNIFMVTISHNSQDFKQEDMSKHIYKNTAHGYLIISNSVYRIINCHLIPKFAAKNQDRFAIIKEKSKNKKCIIAGDFNEKYNKLNNNFLNYSIPYFGPTYKFKKDLDHIIFNFKSKYIVKKLDTYSMSDHCMIYLDIIND